MKQLGIVLVLCVLGTLSRSAAAQPTANDVYSDAKDIITELIEREVAESIAPNLACYSPGGLLKYFPDTLQVVYERNFGALKDTLKRESARLAANYAFQSFRERRSIKLSEFIPANRFEPSDEVTKCAEDIRRSGGPAEYQKALKRRAAGHGDYLPLDACDKPDSTAPDDALPCFVAEAVISSTDGDPSGIVESLARALLRQKLRSDPTLKGLSASVMRELETTLVEEVRARFATGAFPPGGLLATLTAGDGSKALAAAGNWSQVLAEPERAVRTQAMVLGGLLGRPLPTVVVQVGTESTPLPDLLTTLGNLKRDTLPVVAGESLAQALTRALVLQAGKSVQGNVVVTKTDGGLTITLSGAGPASITGVGLSTLEELYDAGLRFVASAPGRELLKKLGAANPAIVVPAVEAAVGVGQVVVEMGRRLVDLSKDDAGHVNAKKMLDAVIGGQFERALCADSPLDPVQPAAAGAGAAAGDAGTPTMTITPCAIWRQAGGLLDPTNELRPILVAASDGNYRELALTVVNAVFSESSSEEVCCGEPASCSETFSLYGRFAKSLVSYVLLNGENQDTALVARAAFKSAAVDVIRSVGSRGGIERKFTDATFLRALVIPTFSLRASWSSSYQIGNEKGVRYVASIDWPTFRFPFTKVDSPLYVAATVTLTDLLAPFAEFVSEDGTLNYNDQRYVWALFIQPRVGATFAFPALSRNLAVSLSGSLRTAAPFGVTETRTGANGKTETFTDYRYASYFGSPAVDPSYSPNDRILKLVEVSAAVQYVP